MMFNNILPWIKGNYEKLILAVLIVVLIMTGLLLLSGKNRSKELEKYKIEIQPPDRPVDLPPVYIPDFERYLVGKSFEQYELLSERAVFFPVEIKQPGPVVSQMNLQCTGVVSDGGGVLTATFRNSQSGKTYKTGVGEKVENFTVVSITRDVVVVSGDDKQYRLKPPVVTMPFKLTGIMPMDTGFQAMLQSDSTKKTYFVNPGDEVENWEVLSIEQNKVIISRPDAGKYELKSGGESQRIQ